MVVLNDFEFKIVSARDKTPCKEHKKGSKTYVEVEPDAEYFLSSQKLRNTSTKLLAQFKVDGKSLGYISSFCSTTSNKGHEGILSWSKGVKRIKALKFVKASFSSEDKGIGSSMTGMGKIEMVVFSAIYMGRKRRKDANLSFGEASTIKRQDNAAVTMKKNLRSGEGSCVETTTYDTNALINKYTRGNHLYTITLHYCATPGLIAVGVLPKPPFWELKRMQHPATITAEDKQKIDKLVISTKRNRNGNEILELADSSDDDSDSDNDKKNTFRPYRVPASNKRAKIKSRS